MQPISSSLRAGLVLALAALSLAMPQAPAGCTKTTTLTLPPQTTTLTLPPETVTLPPTPCPTLTPNPVCVSKGGQCNPNAKPGSTDGTGACCGGSKCVFVNPPGDKTQRGFKCV